MFFKLELEVEMDLKGFGFIVGAVLLVLALFVYSTWDQTRAAADRTQLEIQLERQPEVVQTTAEVGMTVLSKAITGVIVGVILGGGVMIYQHLRIRELENGGWGRFWERRKPISARQSNLKKPRMEDLLLMLLMRDAKRDERK